MNPDNRLVRMTGAMFLLVIASSLTEGVINRELTYSGSAPEILASVAANPTAMLVSISLGLGTAVGIVLLGACLYQVLKAVNGTMAISAFGVFVLEAVAMAMARIFSYSVYRISVENPISNDLDRAWQHNTVWFFQELSEHTYRVHFFFYCVGMLLFISLLIKSKLVPRFISYFGALTVSVGLVGSFFQLFEVTVPMLLFLPILPFELMMGLWLISKGVAIPTNQTAG